MNLVKFSGNLVEKAGVKCIYRLIYLSWCKILLQMGGMDILTGYDHNFRFSDHENTMVAHLP